MTTAAKKKPAKRTAKPRALEKLEKPKAAERKAASQPGPGERVGSVKFTAPTGREPVRDIVGGALGMSGVTYERARTVVEASEDAGLSDDVTDTEVEKLAAVFVRLRVVFRPVLDLAREAEMAEGRAEARARALVATAAMQATAIIRDELVRDDNPRIVRSALVTFAGLLAGMASASAFWAANNGIDVHEAFSGFDMNTLPLGSTVTAAVLEEAIGDDESYGAFVLRYRYVAPEPDAEREGVA